MNRSWSKALTLALDAAAASAAEGAATVPGLASCWLRIGREQLPETIRNQQKSVKNIDITKLYQSG